MSVAAIGAGMVSLIEHATDDHTPAATAWLIGGSVAVLCASLSVIVSLVPQRPGAKLVPYSLAAAALAALVAAAVHPRPWLLAAVLVALLSLSGSRRSSGTRAWATPSSEDDALA